MAFLKALRKSVKAVKPKQKKNPETGNTPTAPAADPKRIESAERLKQAKSKGPQKAYDRIQAEIKWLKQNDGSTESIAKREQSLKDMFVSNVIKKKPMKDVEPRIPADAKADVKAAKKEAELDASVAKVMEALNKRAPQNKARGGVVKKRTGAHDFRMNKGGLLLASVDNRKNK